MKTMFRTHLSLAAEQSAFVCLTLDYNYTDTIELLESRKIFCVSLVDTFPTMSSQLSQQKNPDAEVTFAA